MYIYSNKSVCNIYVVLYLYGVYVNNIMGI